MVFVFKPFTSTISLWWHVILALIQCKFYMSRTLFWWKKLYLPLQTLLRNSGYSDDLQSAYLQFFSRHILPLAGPSPSEFKNIGPMSYMGDDHTPLELSWVLNGSGKHTVRFTLEPLSDDTGAPSPSHTWIDCLRSLSQHSHMSNFDLDWVNTCFSTLIYNGDIFKFNLPHYSQFSIGADFTHGKGIIGKAYFLPHIRSLATGISQMDLVTSCVEQLNLRPQWNLVIKYTTDVAPHLKAVPEIIAVDCIPASQNRIKIYIRSQASSLNEIIDLFTLGGALNEPTVTQALDMIKTLWRLLFPDIDGNTRVQSTDPNHYASRFAIYFELAIGRKFPCPKLYIPVRHYCPNESTVVKAISQLYKQSGFEGMGEVYTKGIQSAFNYSPISKGTGMHTYLGVATRKEGPQLSVYLSPLAFSS